VGTFRLDVHAIYWRWVIHSSSEMSSCISYLSVRPVLLTLCRRSRLWGHCEIASSVGISRRDSPAHDRGKLSRRGCSFRMFDRNGIVVAVPEALVLQASEGRCRGGVRGLGLSAFWHCSEPNQGSAMRRPAISCVSSLPFIVHATRYWQAMDSSGLLLAFPVHCGQT